MGSIRRSRYVRVAILTLICTFIFPGGTTSGWTDQLADNVLGLGDWSPGGGSIATRTAAAFSLTGFRPPPSTPRVLLISSGVDKTAFPPAAQGQFQPVYDPNPSIYLDRPDIVGYGTYAASVILQVMPQALITPMNIYDPWFGKPDDRRLWYAFDLAAHYYPTTFDAIVIAVPPNHFLDPITAAIAAGEWERINDLMTDVPLQGAASPHYGIALDWATLKNQMQGEGSGSQNALVAFQQSGQIFKNTVSWMKEMIGKGTAIVTPAGDLGPKPQTVFGISNLREVITVGATTAGAVSAGSGAGPSLDGWVKPDLVAPTGIVGILPAAGSLTSDLKRINPTLVTSTMTPDWPFGEPLTSARARLDTSITSAALVGAIVAGLGAEGIKNETTVRAALRAASVPIDGVPVWRQGAGELREVPDKEYLDGRPLVLDNGDLGMEPSAGSWTKNIPVANASSVTVDGRSAADFVGMAINGKSRTFTVTNTAARPGLAILPSESNITISGSVGDHAFEAGAYCEYLQISAKGRTTSSALAISIPMTVIEQIPVCLVEGTKVRYKPFYIHAYKSPRTTIGVYPGIPVDLLDRGLGIFPANPTNVPLFVGSAGEDGWVVFNNLPVGSYKFKQFADYGVPTVQDVTSRSVLGVETQVRDPGEIGSALGYLSLNAVVLSTVCGQGLQVTGSYCSGDDLKQKLGDDKVSFHPPTWLYRVGPSASGEQRLRVALGCPADSVTELASGQSANSTCIKKAIGSTVLSRYIDFPTCPDVLQGAAEIPRVLEAGDLVNRAVAPNPAWNVNCLSGTFALAYDQTLDTTPSTAKNMGAGRYSFGLTWPNYTTHIGINFTYELRNVAVVAVVRAGTQSGVAVVGPSTSYYTQSHRLGDLVPQVGEKEGKIRIDFDLLSRGEMSGDLWLLFLPAVNASGAELAQVKDLSLEIDTWTNIDWPTATLTDGEATMLKQQFPVDADKVPQQPGGHYFWVKPNVNQLRQQVDPLSCRLMSDTRTVAQGTETVSANVCEDWSLFVHSPKDDATLVDVVTATNVPFNPTPVDPVWPKAGSGENRTSKIGFLYGLRTQPQKYKRSVYYDLGSRNCEADHDFIFDHSLGMPFSGEGAKIKTRGGLGETVSLPFSFASSVGGDWIEFRIADRVSGTAIAGKNNQNLPHETTPPPLNGPITSQVTRLMPPSFGCTPGFSGLKSLVEVAPYIPNFTRVTSYEFR